jgi:hypothetical protein
MSLPDLRTLTLPQIMLIAGGAIVVLGAIAALGSGGKGRGLGLAVWVMIPFLLVVVGIGIWMLLNVLRIMGPDF